MEITFLGHQSWLVGGGDTHVLVDPILGATFGYCAEAPVHVFPPRTIDLERMPAPHAVVLTHAHSDHFDLRSLARLPRDLPVLVGPLMPGTAMGALRALGFEIVRPPVGEPFRLGALELLLFPAGAETSAHEIGAVQVLARAAGGSGASVFFAADAAPSEWLAERLDAGALRAPDAIVVANNDQRELFPQQRNLLPVAFSSPARERFHGVFLLQNALLDGVPEAVAAIPHVILCAGGIHFGDRGDGPMLFAENKRLAAAARELASGGSVFGAEPGDRYRLANGRLEEDRVSWVELDRGAADALLARQREALWRGEPLPTRPLRPAIESPSERDAALGRAVAALDALVPALTLSPLGQRALRTHEYLGGATDARRILVRLLDDGGRASHHALDFSEGRFVPDETPEDELLDRFPFGLEVHLQDFAALVDGEIPAWELVTQATRSWHFGDADASLRAFLQLAFDEQVRPHAYARLYARVLAEAGCIPPADV
jgi:hypothetical protein